MRTGRFCSHGSTLFDFLDRFDDEEAVWWDRDVDGAAALSSAEFQTGFRTWLETRRAWVIDRFTEECERSGGLSLARCINVSPAWKPGRRALGVFWAFDCAHDLAPHWAKGDKGVDLVLYGRVAPEAINWRETLLSRLDYLNGDGECEVQLRPGAMVRVTGFDGITGLNGGEFRA